MTAAWFALPSGLETDLLSGPCASDGDRVALVVLLSFGADHDPAGRSGMSLLAARVLSAAHPEAAITTDHDHLLYSVLVPRAELEGALDEVARSLTHLEVTDEGLASARSEITSELGRMRGGDPERTASSFAVEAIQPSRGAGWRGGIAEELEAIDRASLQAFVDAHLVAGHARLSIVGAFDPVAIRARVERTFASLPSGTALVPRDPPDSRVLGSLVMGDAPSVVAIAVPAPHVSDPLYPAFLILATRMLRPSEGEVTWTAHYDWVARPETLFVTAPVLPLEAPEVAASRVRAAMAPRLSELLAPADVSATRERFEALFGPQDLSPSTCAADPRALAVARARRAQLGLDALRLSEALERVTEDQLRETAARFGASHATAVIAGGAIR